jgi:hypothetical protein
MIFIHITWDRSQRSHSCLHSIEVDRACKHAHIHKNTHANEGTMPKLLTCAVPTGTIAACQRSLARGPILEKIGTCASLRTVPDPVSASQQRSKLLLLTMRSAGRAPSREAHTRAFPFRSATKFSVARAFLLPGTTRTQKITDLFCYFNRNAHGRGGPGGGCGPCGPELGAVHACVCARQRACVYVHVCVHAGICTVRN